MNFVFFLPLTSLHLLSTGTILFLNLLTYIPGTKLCSLQSFLYITETDFLKQVSQIVSFSSKQLKVKTSLSLLLNLKENYSK